MNGTNATTKGAPNNIKFEQMTSDGSSGYGSKGSSGNESSSGNEGGSDSGSGSGNVDENPFK